MTTTTEKPKKAETPAPRDKRRELDIPDVPGKSADRIGTDIVAQGLAGNANATLSFAQAEFGELSITDMVATLRADGEAVNRGDLSASEQLLNAQAVTLNAIFTNLAQRAHAAKVIPQMETYLRLALKAQSQSRATLETLSVIKNPPVVFTKQMNVANGPQQVNNGPRTLEKTSTPNELFEGLNHARTPLDTRTAAATSREDSRMEPVGAVNRPAHG